MSDTKNKLSDLNDTLFAQLERLSVAGLSADQIDSELKRGKAIVAVADQIVKNAALQVQVAKLVSDKGNIRPLMPAAAGLPEPPQPRLVEAAKK